ncbi:MAG TPA: 50S ribosomal protein L16 [Candidatus Bathyarchaeia archaeon]|nr:50S ribosomal protein L16 [Candidatus Bathyarchaeia archaeon]
MKAKNYRAVKGAPYTRKEYIRASPPSKITKFTMGDTKASFSMQARLIATGAVQIRHNALEAARVASNRVLMTKLANAYVLRVVPYPHTILRENKMIFGAHADRLQDGMRKAFGKPIGIAARVKVGQPIIEIGVNENAVEVAKEALQRGQAKLPVPCRIVIEKTPN